MTGRDYAQRVAQQWKDHDGEPVDAICRLPDDCLMVFIDEAGDHRLSAAQPYFVLAAIAVFKRDYQTAAVDPWHDYFRKYQQVPADLPYHATNCFKRKKSARLTRQLIEFYQKAPIWRFGSGIENVDGNGVATNVAARCLAALLQGVGFWFRTRKQPIGVSSVHYFVEHAAASSHHLIQAMAEPGLMGSSGFAKTSFTMHGKSKEPGAEIADVTCFVVGDRYRTALGNPMKTAGAFRAAFNAPGAGRFFGLMNATEFGRPYALPLDLGGDCTLPF